MSKQRVPRWLTEGVSVYEEGQARPEWGREMEVPFAIAMEQGKVLKLKDLNSGFTKAETIALAYFEASLLVDHIVKSKGEAALRQLLLTYGDGTEGDAAIQKGLGIVDRSAADHVRRRARRAVLVAAGGAARPAAGARPRTSTRCGSPPATMPGSYRAQMAYGLALAEQGDKAAFEPLGKAAALIPVAIGEESPHAVMARLAEKLGDTTRAIAEYRAVPGQRSHGRRRRPPAGRARREGRRRSGAARWPASGSWRSIRSTREAHTGLGRIALKRRTRRSRMREFKAALVTGAADKAVGALRSRPTRICSPASRPRRSGRRWRRSRSRRASSARRTCCSSPSRARAANDRSRAATRPRALRPVLAAAGAAALCGPRRWRLAAARTPRTSSRPDPRFASLSGPSPASATTRGRCRRAAATTSSTSRGRSISRPPSRTCRGASRTVDLDPGPRPGRAQPRGSESLELPVDLHRRSRATCGCARREVPILREFLLRGGTLTFDDFHGPIEWDNVERELKRVFPDRKIVDLPPRASDLSLLLPVRRLSRRRPGSARSCRGAPGRRAATPPHLRAIEDDAGRAMVLINWNVDMGDGVGVVERVRLSGLRQVHRAGVPDGDQRDHLLADTLMPSMTDALQSPTSTDVADASPTRRRTRILDRDPQGHRRPGRGDRSGADGAVHRRPLPDHRRARAWPRRC